MSRVRRKLSWLALPVVLGLIYSSVVLFAPVWHLFHGDSISYQGWRIPVASAFFAKRGSGGPSLIRITIGTLLWDGPSADIHFSVFPKAFYFATEYQGFAAGSARAASHLGYQPSAHNEVRIGGATGYCLEFIRPGTKAKSYIQCALEGSKLFILYIGSSEYVSEFYSTLEGMKHP